MEIIATQNDLTPTDASGRDFLWMSWSGIISIANSLLVWIFMTRMRDVEDVASFAIVMGLYALFFSVVSLGLESYLINEISRRRASVVRSQGSNSGFISSASILLLISGIASAVVMTATAFMVSESWVVRSATIAMSLALLPTGLILICEATAIAYGRVRLMSVVSTFETVVRTVVPIALIWAGFDIFTIALSFAAIRFLPLIAYLAVARRHLKLFDSSAPAFRNLALACPTFAGTNIFASINRQAALILLGYMSTEAEAAKFGAASRFLIPVTILMASYATVIQPVIARFAKDAPESIGMQVAKMARFPLIAAAFVAVLSPFFSSWAMTILFGDFYAGAAPALDVLALSIVPFCLVVVVARALISVDLQRIDLFANVLGVAVCVCTALFLIPRFGAVGAATAQLLSFVAMAVVVLGYLSKKTGRFRMAKRVGFVGGLEAILGKNSAFGSISIGRIAPFLTVAPSVVPGVQMNQFRLQSKAIDRLRFSPRTGSDAAHVVAEDKLAILMVGMHLTKTRGGISTLTADILNSTLKDEFNFTYVASQAEDLGVFGKCLLAIYAAFRFIGICLFRRPALIYVHLGSNSSLYRESVFIVLARLLRTKVLSHFHAGDIREYLARQPDIGRKFVGWAISLSNRVIAVSSESAGHLAQLDRSIRISVIPNAIDTGAFTGLSGDSGTRTDKDIHVLFVGAVGKLKGEKDLIRALAMLKDQNINLQASFLGYDAESLAEYCGQIGVMNMIRHLGPVSRAERFSHFDRADIFVLPTYAEAMPISVIEAMAAGLPVVTTPVGGIPEILTNGEDGLLFPCGDIDALAQKIAFLIKNPEERDAMGKKARKKVREQMDFAAYTALLRAELRDVISSD